LAGIVDIPEHLRDGLAVLTAGDALGGRQDEDEVPTRSYNRPRRLLGIGQTNRIVHNLDGFGGDLLNFRDDSIGRESARQDVRYTERLEEVRVFLRGGGDNRRETG
jgi:hypothetical protein